MKVLRNSMIILVCLVGILYVAPIATFAGNPDKYLSRKLAVATYYEQILKQNYGTAGITVTGAKNNILSIVMIRVPEDRIKTILDAGLYRDAKKARFKEIIFTDALQHKTSVDIR